MGQVSEYKLSLIRNAQKTIALCHCKTHDDFEPYAVRLSLGRAGQSARNGRCGRPPVISVNKEQP